MMLRQSSVFINTLQVLSRYMKFVATVTFIMMGCEHLNNEIQYFNNNFGILVSVL